MCELGGEIIHAAPTNNWPNHGFYQLSPTLFHDYYTANGFEVIGSYFTRYAAVPSDPVNRLRYRHDASFRDPIPLDGCRYLFWFHARKIAESDRPVFPQQAAYAALAQWDPLKSSKDGKGPMAPLPDSRSASRRRGQGSGMAAGHVARGDVADDAATEPERAVLSSAAGWRR